jgi:RNA polymerase sigma-70 factor (ECF subfamily)
MMSIATIPPASEVCRPRPGRTLARTLVPRLVSAGMPPSEVQQDSTAAEEAQLVVRLRAGDEEAFEALVRRYHTPMMAVARNYVKTRAVAEEVVQDAWMGVLKGIDRFEGRSLLKAWIMRIVINTATTRGVREARSVPFSSLAPEGEHEPAVDPDRFRGPDGGFPGHWAGYPANWSEQPQDRLLGRETLGVVKDAIDNLPPAQRTVITLRDMQGWNPEEVSATLEISDGNQRVLLHRARSKVRSALEAHLGD